MMLNKQMLALAFAAGATFLVGCDEDAQVGECAGEAFFEALPDQTSECWKCLAGEATSLPEPSDPKFIEKFENCGVEFQYACDGMDDLTKGQTADTTAAQGLITTATANNKFNANDKTKNDHQGLSCGYCFSAHHTASTKESATDKVDDAFEECGVTVKDA